MTELETLVAVMGAITGTLLGVVVTHVFEARRENRRLSREIALRPLDDKHSALKQAQFSLVE
jgi:hypothetical protein